MQVKEELARRIVSGVYQTGDTLPNEAVLSQALGVSIGTVRKAVEMLVEDKAIIRAPGRGTVVADRKSPDFQNHLNRIRGPRGAQLQMECRALRVEQRRASDAECQVLRLDPPADVLVVRRVREIAGRPSKREYCRLPARLFAPLDATRVEETTIERLAVAKGILIGYSDEWLSLIDATDPIARDLKVEAGARVLRMERLVYDDRGDPIEWRVAHCGLEGAFYHAPSPFGARQDRQHVADANFARHLGLTEDA